jgi:hypothetical protein
MSSADGIASRKLGISGKGIARHRPRYGPRLLPSHVRTNTSHVEPAHRHFGRGMYCLGCSPFQYWHVEACLGVLDETLQVRLTDTSDGVDICTRAASGQRTAEGRAKEMRLEDKRSKSPRGREPRTLYSLVFRKIPAQALIDIRAAENEQTPDLTPDPWQELSEHVRHDHS